MILEMECVTNLTLPSPCCHCVPGIPFLKACSAWSTRFFVCVGGVFVFKGYTGFLMFLNLPLLWAYELATLSPWKTPDLAAH